MIFMRVSYINNAIKPILLLGLAVGVLFFAVPSQAATKVPHFALPSPTDGKTIDINAYKNKVVLINFFATWCPPCRKEIKSSLIDLQKAYGDKHFTVIGISMDTGGRRAKIVTKFIEKIGINFPVVLADRKIANDFGGVIGIPQSFLVDQDGNVVKSYPGYVDHETFERDIENLIK